MKDSGNAARNTSLEKTDRAGGDGAQGLGTSAYSRHGSGRGPRRSDHGRNERLTGRERWIVSQLVKHKGAPNKVIAHALRISPNTLRNHLASIYAKLGVRRRVELVLYAIEQGLDAVPDK